MSLHVIARFRARDGKENELREVLQTLIVPTRAENGCIRYELFENPADGRDLVFVEEWTDDAALDAHLQTAHIAHARNRFAELVEGELDLLRIRKIG